MRSNRMHNFLRLFSIPKGIPPRPVLHAILVFPLDAHLRRGPDALLGVIDDVFLTAVIASSETPNLDRRRGHDLALLAASHAAIVLAAEAHASILHAAHGVAVASSAAAAAGALGGLLTPAADQGGERRDGGDDYAEVVFDHGPHDQRAGIEVIGQRVDGLDTYDLDDGNESAETEEAVEDNLFLNWDLGFEEDGEG